MRMNLRTVRTKLEDIRRDAEAAIRLKTLQLRQGDQTPTDPMDDAQNHALHAVSSGEATQHARLLDQANDALLRLNQGKYGQCASCDESIDEKRLLALPFAERCLDCQEEFEQAVAPV